MIEKIRKAIAEYYMEEFEDTEEEAYEQFDACFLNSVGLAYTELGDEEVYSVQVTANLVDCRLEFYFQEEGQPRFVEKFSSLEEMYKSELEYLSFEELVYRYGVI